MVTGIYQIGDAKILVEAPENLSEPENLKLFRMESGNIVQSFASYDCHYILHLENDFAKLIQTLLAMKTGPVFKREDLTIFQTNTGECRLMNFKGADWYYAASLQKENNQCEIWFSSQAEDELSWDTIFWAPFCLERLMIKKGGLVLHSAYMERSNEAVLFSAPSGTGKSTQADLWTKYRKTRTVNGDRTLLMKQDGCWMAYGWPICGSSKICFNESYPLRAIVMLRQAKENKIRSLRGLEAVRNVFGQLMVNGWSRSFQETAMDLLEDLLKQIPVVELSCDISEQAVTCLEQWLLENEQ